MALAAKLTQIVPNIPVKLEVNKTNYPKLKIVNIFLVEFKFK